MRRTPGVITLSLVLLAASGCASQTPLLKAIHEGDPARVQSLLENGASPNEASGCRPGEVLNTTPLICAFELDRPDIVKLLVARGADVNRIGNHAGKTPLMAAASGDIGTVTLLLSKGADVNGRGQGYYPGQTALMLAARYGKTETVKLLLDRGADIGAENIYGWTAVSFAIGQQKSDTAKLLVSRGADIDADVRKREADAVKEGKKPEESAAYRLARSLRDAVRACGATFRDDADGEAAFRAAAAKYLAAPVKPELPEEAREFKVQAEYAIGEKRFPDAVRLYARALAISPWWPEGHFNRALILGELSCPEDAIAEMNRYIVLAPDAPDIRAARDRIYLWKGMIP